MQVCICAFIAVAAVSAVGARPGGGEDALRELVRNDLRVAAAGLRLAVANVDRCSSRMPATGLVLHSLAQYRGKSRGVASRYFGDIEDLSVEGVVAQSPAALAGIRQGDALIAINGSRLEQAGASPREPTRARDLAEDRLNALPPGERIILTLRREGTTRDFAVMPIAACRSRFEMVAGSGMFAVSDGRVIQIGQGLVEAVSDTDLAAITAHELAHTILEHRSRLAEVERSRDRRSRERRRQLAREFEEQADRLSVHLLVAAGFDPRSAPGFMRRFGKSFDSPSAVGIHASSEARAARMDDEIARTKLVPAAGP
jgi:hypothetical protein